jgi:hypothetical protein
MTLPPIDWTTPWPWFITLLLIAITAVSIWQIGQQTSLSRRRKTVRMGLLGLLLLALLGLWLQPRWRPQLPAGRVLLVADDVPDATVRAVRDSLGFRQTIRARAFRGATDSVTLLGQSFSKKIGSLVARQVVSWVPYEADNQVQSLQWQGIVQLGQSQSIRGQIRSSEGNMLRLRFGTRVVDSTRIATGNQSFMLDYPVFSLGRNSPTLWLGNVLLDTLHFVVRPAARMHIRFILTAPDFETRTLADWLGRQGHRVELTSTLSKGIGTSLAINGAVSGKNKLPDLIITDPATVNDALVNNALSVGKNVLVLNMTQPDANIATINRTLHTRWQLRRIPGKDTLHIGPVLTALPYRIVPTNHTLLVPGYPVAIQPAAGRVAVSLLTETFPLRLGGDTLAYNRLWLSVMAQLRPQSVNNFTIEAPVYQHVPVQIGLNSPTVVPTTVRVGNDTVTMRPTPLNARLWEGLTRPTKTGWLPLQDTLATYIYPTETAKTGAIGQLALRQQTAAVALAHRRYDTLRPTEARFIDKAVPDWVWFVLIVSVLTTLWLEPKLG